ncbi:hypothetical protein ACFSHT_13785 [Paraburkholderia silviterrae]|uniref:hypothetical protein n=1 Tax=Paraburkholderia silviterrae TaxID=2528715 RepID=UPI0014042A91|nr:hypothetical protein [Paraburkholderia silviterrae]
MGDLLKGLAAVRLGISLVHEAPFIEGDNPHAAATLTRDRNTPVPTAILLENVKNGTRGFHFMLQR